MSARLVAATRSLCEYANGIGGKQCDATCEPPSSAAAVLSLLRDAAVFAACETRVEALEQGVALTLEAEAALMDASLMEPLSRLDSLSAAAAALRAASGFLTGTMDRLHQDASSHFVSVSRSCLQALHAELSAHLVNLDWPPVRVLTAVSSLASWQAAPSCVAVAALLDSLPPSGDASKADPYPRSISLLAAPLCKLLLENASHLSSRPAWLFAATLRCCDAATPAAEALRPAADARPALCTFLASAAKDILIKHTLPALALAGMTPPTPQQWLVLAEEAGAFDAALMDRDAQPALLSSLASTREWMKRWCAAELESSIRNLDAIEADGKSVWAASTMTFSEEGICLAPMSEAVLQQLTLLSNTAGFLLPCQQAEFLEQTAEKLCRDLLRRLHHTAEDVATCGSRCSAAGADTLLGCVLTAVVVRDGVLATASRVQHSVATPLEALAERFTSFADDGLEQLAAFVRARDPSSHDLLNSLAFIPTVLYARLSRLVSIVT